MSQLLSPRYKHRAFSCISKSSCLFILALNKTTCHLSHMKFNWFFSSPGAWAATVVFLHWLYTFSFLPTTHLKKFCVCGHGHRISWKFFFIIFDLNVYKIWCMFWLWCRPRSMSANLGLLNWWWLSPYYGQILNRSLKCYVQLLSLTHNTYQTSRINRNPRESPSETWHC